MATDYKFQGWLGLDKDAANGKMIWQEYEPKTWTEDDVDIKVTHCGICGSDLHTLRSGWVSYQLVFLLNPLTLEGDKADKDFLNRARPFTHAA